MYNCPLNLTAGSAFSRGVLLRYRKSHHYFRRSGYPRPPVFAWPWPFRPRAFSSIWCAGSETIPANTEELIGEQPCMVRFCASFQIVFDF